MTLSSLTINNVHFEKCKAEFPEKLKTSSFAADRQEFISAEVIRVENLYSHPSVEISVDGKRPANIFYYSQFQHTAYDSLLSGHDWPIDNILRNAKHQYSEAFKSAPDNVEYMINSGELERNVVENLAIGVGWAMYRKYLSDQLNSNTVNNQLSIDKLFTANGWQAFKGLLNEIDLTIDEIPNPEIKKGRVGKFTAAVDAACNTIGMLSLDKPKPELLRQPLNNYLNTKYKTLSKRNEDYPEYYLIAIDYLKRNLKK